jgi:hypothetical protein
VQHPVAAPHGNEQALEVDDVRDHGLDLAPSRIGEPAQVEDAHVVGLALKRLHHVRPDEPGAADDEGLYGLVSTACGTVAEDSHSGR